MNGRTYTKLDVKLGKLSDLNKINFMIFYTCLGSWENCDLTLSCKNRYDPPPSGQF